MKICTKCKIKKENKFFYKDEQTKDKLRSCCKFCDDLKNKVYHEKHRDERLAYFSSKRENKKQKVLQHYSKSKTPFCNCCGSVIKEFLTIDHINGNGNKHRIKSGKDMYHILHKENYPKGFQVLCMNCNFAKGVSSKCPVHTTTEIIFNLQKPIGQRFSLL